jgi:SIR2-like domain
MKNAIKYLDGLGANYRPPLANELLQNRDSFREFLNRFDQCGPLVQKLRTEMVREGNDFYLEGHLEDYRQREDSDAVKRQLKAFRFYLQHVIWRCSAEWIEGAGGVTNYSAWLDRLAEWQEDTGQTVLLVTFNYDTFLEHALGAVLGLHFNDMDAYVSDQRFQLLKLHGSVNWSRLIPTTVFYENNDVARRMVIEDHSLTPTDDYVIRSPDKTSGSHKALYYPALAIPVLTKTEFECPAAQIDVVRDAVSKIEKVITIGWRGTERHFLQLLDGLGGRNVPILIVSGDDQGTRQTEEQLEMGQLVGPKVRFHQGESSNGFSGLLETDVQDRFLASTPQNVGGLQAELN